MDCLDTTTTTTTINNKNNNASTIKNSNLDSIKKDSTTKE